MAFFRHYKSVDELAPGFKMEKETEIAHRSAFAYNTTVLAFSDWLNEHGISSATSILNIR